MRKIHPFLIQTIIISTVSCFLFSCSGGEDKALEQAFIEKIEMERRVKGAEITDSTVSRFNAEERAAFEKKGLQYFQPDMDYKVSAQFELDTSNPVFQMPTTTDRKPNYRIYGYLDFVVKDTSCRLVVFQNYDIKDHPSTVNMFSYPLRITPMNLVPTVAGGTSISRSLTLSW